MPSLKECIEARIAKGLDGFANFNKPQGEWPKYCFHGWTTIQWISPLFTNDGDYRAIDNNLYAATYQDGDYWREYTEPKKPMTLECEVEWHELHTSKNFIIYPNIGAVSKFVGKKTKMVLTEILEEK